MDIQRIQSLSIFSGFSTNQLELVKQSIRTETYARGAMVFKRGREIDDIFFLLSGQVRLVDRQYQTRYIKSDSDDAIYPLNQDSPSSVSCIADSDINVVWINRSVLTNIQTTQTIQQPQPGRIEDLAPIGFQTMEVETVGEADSEDWMSSLLLSPLFRRLPTSHVQDLFKCFEDVAVKKGECVVKEGETGDYFYVLSHGTAQVANSTQSVNVSLNSGSYFGEEALLGNTLRNATITMLTDGSIKRLDAQTFQKLLKEPVLKYIEVSKMDSLTEPYQILDVKMPFEFKFGHREGSVNMPLSKLRSFIPEMDPKQTYLISDDGGNRADVAAHILCQAGFDAMILREA